MEELANEIEIHLASSADVEALHSVLAECGLDMRDRLGLTHWTPPYPLQLFETQAKKGEVYSVRVPESDRPVATFTASRDAPAYLDLSLWDASGEPSLYFTRLAVLPRFQRRGIGRACVGAVEQLTLDHGCCSIRLDAAESHAELLDWYLDLGYRESCRYEAFGTRMVGFEKLVSLRAA